MTKRLETVQAVIETLYGRAADAARELKRSRTAIWKYQQRGELPGDLYQSIQAKAALNGDFVVADELFTHVTIHPSVLFRKEA
jgi:hypothetical protein